MDFLKDFGVQPILLAAQVVNFLILLLILKRFLYKPILKMLDERKKVIAQSLKNAEEIESRLQKIAEEEEKALAKSLKEGEKVIQQAQEASIQIIKEAKEKSEDMAEKILTNARSELQAEKQKLEEEMREHLADFVVLGLQKITGKVLNEKDRKDLITQSLKGLK